jgi:acetate CoA/acetoacetate CoA-transferase beta subunit
MSPQIIIARRIARELKAGMLVNLGIGIPTLVANYVPEGRHPGLLPIGKRAYRDGCDPGRRHGTPHADRRGRTTRDRFAGCQHVRQRDILRLDPWRPRRCNGPWRIAGGSGWSPGQLDDPRPHGPWDGRRNGPRLRCQTCDRGDAANSKGKSKIVKECDLPLTSIRPVHLVVTELAVIAFLNGQALLQETAPGISVQQVIDATEAELVVPANVPEMVL